MLGLATRASVLGTFLQKLSRAKDGRFLLFSCKRSTQVGKFSRGYAVICSECGSLFDKQITAGGKSKESFFGQLRWLSTEEDLKSISFEKICNETLESLSEYFDEIIEEADHLQDADVSYGDGVLTIKFGKEYGTYVLNRQVPNQQIWLSSPKSGPKRYDIIDGTWIYKHDGKSLYDLLNEEIPDVVKFPVSFDKCSYGLGKK
ncbi:frataxin homolog, mitochondrial [Copidosoma floridanum]|uniref:frataxin homolog, mitochondrial n=1 Tax=Copidosoma floridanum TaxID=29053 RepID=UPI0006C98CB2|nr:frataxin homolog, mitochondrial [Copidosoma floridanum]